jgi:hypothetical protein
LIYFSKQIFWDDVPNGFGTFMTWSGLLSLHYFSSNVTFAETFNKEAFHKFACPVDMAKNDETEIILPIRRFAEDIIAAVRDNDTAVVIGETGSGKTTQLSQVGPHSQSPLQLILFSSSYDSILIHADSSGGKIR